MTKFSQNSEKSLLQNQNSNAIMKLHRLNPVICFVWTKIKTIKKMLTIGFVRDSINELRVKHIAAENLDN